MGLPFSPDFVLILLTHLNQLRFLHFISRKIHIHKSGSRGVINIAYLRKKKHLGCLV